MSRYILGLFCFALFIFCVIQSDRANRMQGKLWLAEERAESASLLAVSASVGWVEAELALRRCHKATAGKVSVWLP